MGNFEIDSNIKLLFIFGLPNSTNLLNDSNFTRELQNENNEFKDMIITGTNNHKSHKSLFFAV